MRSTILKRFLTSSLASVVMSSLATQFSPVHAQPLIPVSIDTSKQGDRPRLTIKLVDNLTKRPIRNVKVEVYSDNGIRCITYPCPTNGISWQGKTDGNGIVLIPGSVRQHSMHISATGYSSSVELNRQSKKTASGVWIVALERE